MALQALFYEALARLVSVSFASLAQKLPPHLQVAGGTSPTRPRSGGLFGRERPSVREF